MIDIERMYKYMDLLEGKRFVTASEFMTKMEISHATFKRDLVVLRERFDVPIIYDRDYGAYKLDQTCNRKRLPGIWFSPEEIKVIRVMSSQILTLEGPNFDDAYQILNSKFERIGMPEVH
jgi:predicted DNA-binding transcriptional regulator YafY